MHIYIGVNYTNTPEIYWKLDNFFGGCWFFFSFLHAYMNMIFFLILILICVLCCRYDYSGYGQSSGKVCDFVFFCNFILFWYFVWIGFW